MRILLTNDDGIHAAGLEALRDSLSGLGDVHVVAPAFEQSGVSHAFSILGMLRYEEVKHKGELFGYAVNGTPVDTVKMALDEILPEPPDIIVSGINHGENSGVNILYSGTLAAAMEGTVLGIPAIAVSVASLRVTDFSIAADFIRKLCIKLPELNLPKDTMLNVNVPNLPKGQIKGVKITRQADSHYNEEIEKRHDPRGREYYWIGGVCINDSKGDDNDMAAVRAGYISITPVRINQTNHDYISTLKGIDFG
ncbi:MAG: 5'/3'-nucleotidase SurE [Calditrichaeota bacterium]|nr:5'/3'-nucleotidase SurE [Calditrichota bacterium]